MKQTILVTGGTGFIGSHTSVELIEAGYNVVIVDDLSNSKIEVLDGIEKITGVRPAFEQVDLRDREATENVFRKYPKIEGIIHFAASKAVGESVQKPLMYYRNNIVSLVNLALIGELPNGVPNNLIPFVTQTAMGIRKELTIFGNDYNTPDGTCIRDYIYVVDLAKAHVAAMKRILDKKSDNIEYFNIGTGHGNTTREIVETFEKATGVKVNWKFGPRREGDIEKIWGDCTKVNTVLGWKADTPLSDVLASAWKWQEKLRADGVM